MVVSKMVAVDKATGTRTAATTRAAATPLRWLRRVCMASDRARGVDAARRRGAVPLRRDAVGRRAEVHCILRDAAGAESTTRRRVAPGEYPLLEHRRGTSSTLPREAAVPPEDATLPMHPQWLRRTPPAPCAVAHRGARCDVRLMLHRATPARLSAAPLSWHRRSPAGKKMPFAPGYTVWDLTWPRYPGSPRRVTSSTTSFATVYCSAT